MKANFHTHTTWCDGKNSVDEMVAAALERGFDALGFSSHLDMLGDRVKDYVADVRRAAAQYKDRLRIACGIEADYIPGQASPDRAALSAYGFDYIIGSIHYVKAPDGALVCVDDTPELLMSGIRDHFAGDAVRYVKAYFAQEREMVCACSFDVVGHADLVRKFNQKCPYFDETAPWYRDEVEETAQAIAKSGKITEINTGAIARGWLDEAYPGPAFRARLAELQVPFILSSDAHAAPALDGAFERFSCEKLKFVVDFLAKIRYNM